MTTSTINDTKPHYALLDGLRGVAALLVVWYHIFEGYQFAGGKPTIDFINHGYLAVDFFFVLSGFVIGYAYDDRWGKSLNTGKFFIRRLIRLHPMVIMGALIGTISFALTGLERGDGTLALLCGCLMLPALPGMPREVRGNGEMFPLNGPCWSLFFEYIGNILYAIFIRRLSTRGLTVLSVLMSCCLAWFAVTDQSGYSSIGVGWTADTMNVLGGTLRMLCPFTAGMLISRVFRPKHVRGAFWWCAAVLLVLFHVPFIESDGALCVNGIFETVCIVGVFPLIVWAAASGKTTDRMSTSVCRFLGDISYPLYIVHYPVMYLLYHWLWTCERSIEATIVAVVTAVASSIVIAYVAMRFYDTPVRARLSKIGAKNKQ